VVDDRIVDKRTTERMATHFLNLLEALAARPQDPLHSLPMVGDDERHRILVELNDTVREGHAATPLAALIEAQARQIPKAVAFTEESGRSLTFDLLAQRPNKWATLLIDRGVLPGSVVGVPPPRSIDAATAFLAILKARAVSLPLDPRYPQERLAY